MPTPGLATTPWLGYTRKTPNANIDTWLPTEGRNVISVPEYLNNNRTFHIRDYGGRPSASGASNSVALNDAITALNLAGGGVIQLDRGRYNFSDKILGADGVVIQGQGRESTFLDFSESEAPTACMQFEGSYEELPDFVGDLRQYDRQITFAETPNLQPGDVFFLYNSEDYSWVGVLPHYRAGEFCRVQEIAGSVVTIETPLYDDYVANATTKVYKQLPVKCAFRHFSAEFSRGRSGIYIVRGNRVTFKDLYATGSDYSNVSLTKSYEASFDGVDIYDVSPTTPGLNYGVSIGNSSRVTMRGCNMATARHSVSTGGDANLGCFPCRELLFADSIFGSTRQEQFGFLYHANTENTQIDNCWFPQGCAIGGGRMSIYNSRIWTNHFGSPQGLYFVTLRDTDIEIKNVTITQTKEVTSGSTSAMLSMGRGTTQTWSYIRKEGTIRIDGLYLDHGGFDAYGINIQNLYNDVTRPKLDIRNVRNINTAGINPALVITGSQTLPTGFDEIVIDNFDPGNMPMTFQNTNSRHIVVDGVRMTSSPTHGISFIRNNLGYVSGIDRQMYLFKNIHISGTNNYGLGISGDGDGSRTEIILDTADIRECCKASQRAVNSLDRCNMRLTIAASVRMRNVKHGAKPRVVAVNTTSTASATSNTITASGTPGWSTNAYRGYVVCIIGGTGVGGARVIASNTSDTITVTDAWTTTPDATSTFQVISLDVLVSSTNVDSGTTNTLTADGSPGWAVGTYVGHAVRIISGVGAGQMRTIISNTADTLTVSPTWDTPPDNTSAFEIVSNQLPSIWLTNSLAVSTVTEFEEFNNQFFGNITENVSSVSRRISYRPTQTNVVGYGTAAPSSGTYATGDTWVNTDPGSNGISEWRCTSGGTSGSWIALYFVAPPAATAAITSSVALNNGAGAGAGTLANAPTAGDPTKWIPINDNGTTRYIPTWT